MVVFKELLELNVKSEVIMNLNVLDYSFTYLVSIWLDEIEKEEKREGITRY